jgi:SAM-dependent methyltransferase
LGEHPFTVALPLHSNAEIAVFLQSAFEIHAYRRRSYTDAHIKARERLAVFRQMLESFQVYGFVPQRGGMIEIHQNKGGKFFVAEGRHRCSIMHHLYGPDAVLVVNSGQVTGIIFPENTVALRADLVRKYHAGGTRHVGKNKGLYQSVPQLGIPGRRDTAYRLKQYDLENFLKETDRVLDIGCNCGAMSVSIAPLVRKVNGIDNDKSSIEVARIVASALDANNVEFDWANADNMLNAITDDTYDAVLSFAVHRWIKTPVKDYLRTIHRILKPGGRCLFESHNADGFAALVGENTAGLFKAERWGEVNDKGDARREFVVLVSLKRKGTT